MNGGFDAVVRSTATDIAAHGHFDIRIARIRIAFQQRRCTHDLPTLAEPALRYADVYPGLLYLLTDGVGCNALYRRDRFADSRADRCHAGTNGLAFQVHRTGTTEPHAAAEFGAAKAQDIANGPQ